MNAVKRFYLKYIKPWVKALASAIGGAVGGVIINIIKGETAFPQSQQELLTVLVAAILPAILTVVSPANKITQKQLEKDPGVIGGAVVDERPAGIPGKTGTVVDGLINVAPGGSGGTGGTNATYTTYPHPWKS